MSTATATSTATAIPTTASTTAAPAARSRNAVAPVIASATLLQGHDAITIEHHGRQYQLRQTKQGKLILTK